MSGRWPRTLADIKELAEKVAGGLAEGQDAEVLGEEVLSIIEDMHYVFERIYNIRKEDITSREKLHHVKDLSEKIIEAEEGPDFQEYEYVWGGGHVPAGTPVGYEDKDGLHLFEHIVYSNTPREKEVEQ